MKDKDLFNAIHDIDEDYITSAWLDTEVDHPIIVRPEKRSVKRTVRSIMLGVGGAAAAAALCLAVISGANGFLRNPFSTSSSSSETDDDKMNYIFKMFDNRKSWIENAERDIVRIGCAGYLREKLDANGSAAGEPDCYYFNDFPIQADKLSDSTKEWLKNYDSLSDEDKAKQNPIPDDLLMAEPWYRVRYGDVGFFINWRTEEELNQIQKYCENPMIWSCYPPEPDIYYYEDRPYTTPILKATFSADTAEWLRWYCWLSEEEQEQMSGFIPSELQSDDSISCPEFPETVAYNGKEIVIGELEKIDTACYLVWYDSLPKDLQDKVSYVPSELHQNNNEHSSDAPDHGTSLPIELIGADYADLTYEDLAHATIMKYGDDGELHDLDISELEDWDIIICYGFTYLSKPGSTYFERYNVGDEYNGLKITDAGARFVKLDTEHVNPVFQYVGGEVKFEGEITVDALIMKHDDVDDRYFCAVSGLPIIDVDEETRGLGRLRPKIHSAEEFADDPNALLDQHNNGYLGYFLGSDERLEEGAGTIVRDITISDLYLWWQDFYNDESINWWQDYYGAESLDSYIVFANLV